MTDSMASYLSDCTQLGPSHWCRRGLNLYSRGPQMWTLEGQTKSVHIGERSTVVVSNHKSLMVLEIFIPTIYHYLKIDNEIPWNTLKCHELRSYHRCLPTFGSLSPLLHAMVVGIVSTHKSLRSDIKSCGRISIFSKLKIEGGWGKRANFGKIKTKDRYSMPAIPATLEKLD